MGFDLAFPQLAMYRSWQAAILIGVNVARYLRHIPMSRFSLVLGFLALLAALGQFWRVDLPLLAICLVIIGGSLVIKPLLTRAA